MKIAALTTVISSCAVAANAVLLAEETSQVESLFAIEGHKFTVDNGNVIGHVSLSRWSNILLENGLRSRRALAERVEEPGSDTGLSSDGLRSVRKGSRENEKDRHLKGKSGNGSGKGSKSGKGAQDEAPALTRPWFIESDDCDNGFLVDNGKVLDFVTETDADPDSQGLCLGNTCDGEVKAALTGTRDNLAGTDTLIITVVSENDELYISCPDITQVPTATVVFCNVVDGLDRDEECDVCIDTDVSTCNSPDLTIDLDDGSTASHELELDSDDDLVYQVMITCTDVARPLYAN